MKVLLLFFGMAFGLVSTFLGLLVYFLPSMLAWGKSRFTTIFLVNLIFGGTVIGWIVALIWAMGAEKRPAQIEAAE
ncbi:MAG: superinfection immunity protein [Candidatus Wallbacteria bacterium HGW-Wallbacteria-1]|uniref:Superinfection immunity protein n=1 Tax=Candidatus Wallbacteria bacterium HGW-Wallbacteria-1 TaxID=2013854 RepID=A0A2N1PNB2_9BACT|nr:MAG: superinfection immunity protein [Candidatus Wallbacteria bacterium HGW-Wallbacteria-1]